VQAGAKAFAAQGCANCHGAPGVNWAKYSEGLHPDPPDLKEIVDHRSPSQLFWVVKNGINMTGMPSFALAGAKDDEIWSIVAFLKKLPGVSEADYKVWTAPPVAAPTPVPPTPPAVAPAPNPPRGNLIHGFSSPLRPRSCKAWPGQRFGLASGACQCGGGCRAIR
jgi:mono/diheme cytochrome c family protein